MKRTPGLRFLGLMLLLLTGLVQRGNAQMGDGQIMVVPFQPNQYFCPNDQFICQASNLTPAGLVKTFRASVAAKLVGNLSERWNTTQVSDKTALNEQQSDIELLYHSAVYKQEEKPLVGLYKKTDDKNKPSADNLFGLKKNEKNAPEYLNPEKPNMRKHSYFRAEFSDKTRVKEIANRNNVSFFLFLNHFELETRFQDCTQMHKDVSTRDMYVHYTLLDAEGNFVDGGVVCTTFVSSSNEVNEILKNTLPSIANMIITEIKPKISI